MLIKGNITEITNARDRRALLEQVQPNLEQAQTKNRQSLVITEVTAKIVGLIATSRNSLFLLPNRGR